MYSIYKVSMYSISVCTVYRYLVSRYVYSVSKYIQIESAGADDTVQDKRYTDRRQMKTAHSQDRQPERTQTRAGHDEHTQKGARRAQKAARRHLKGKG